MLGSACLASIACDGSSGAGSAADGGLGVDASVGRWSAHDLSILYPLPAAGEQALLIAMETTHRGASTRLLPAALFAKLGTELTPLIETDRRDLYPVLRVVSVRLDPCVEGASPCRQQVRLSVQPLSETAEGGLYDLLDGSVHLFYDVEALEWVRLVREIRRLSQGRFRNVPLSVHPILVDEGLAGPFARGLREALLDACDQDKLVRFTFMVQLRSSVNWAFHILDRQADGRFTVSRIPGDSPPASEIGSQTVDGYADFGDFGVGDLVRNGAPRFEPWFPNAILSTRLSTAMSDGEYRSAIDALRTIENPSLRTTAQVRCATCHLGHATVRLSAVERGLTVPPASSSMYPGALAHQPGAVVKTNMHAFSYFNRIPTISQRVANDTHLGLSLLEDARWIAALPDDARRALLEP